ncbi:aldehyde:ferredoxin oxidoreductase [Candidatus Hakubella thermalkaliphila]|nr:aldehyde:ferredoxin oxidoreductase [Candidatus Hakubella thermalkaliphila]
MVKLQVFETPTAIKHAPGAVENLADEARRLEGRKPLLVTDQGVVKAGLLDRIVGSLEKEKITFGLFDRVVGNPPVELVGSNLGLGDLEGVAYAVRLCDELGMDSMSTGGVIGFATEALEKGAITTSDLGGLDLKFGDRSSVIELVKMIASRENPLARLLGEGVKRASEQIPGTEEYAVHIKDLESPAWGPSGAPGMGLALMTADRGGCHQRAFPILYQVGGELWEDREIKRLETRGKAELVTDLQNYLAALDTLVKCDFAQYDITKKTYLEMLSSAIGREYSLDDLMRLGERVWNMVRLFNVREGFSRKDDHLPPRFVKESLPDGPAAGHRITEEDMEVMLDEYYKVRGWDGQGRPSQRKLEELGLERLQVPLKT